MKSYIIPVFGKCPLDRERWQFAFAALGYKLAEFRKFTVSEPATIKADSKSGGVEDTPQKGDEVLVIKTDAPRNVMDALWSMTGLVCGFIGSSDDEIKSFDDLVSGSVKIDLDNGVVNA